MIRIQNVDEQRKLKEDSQSISMPFNLNNVDVTVRIILFVVKRDFSKHNFIYMNFS